MKKTILLAVVAMSVVSLSLLADDGGPVDRKALWKKVEEAKQKGLPKTAIELLAPIIASAEKEGAHAEAIKALVEKIALEGTIQGNKPEEKITRLQAAIAKARPENRPVMEAILAHWYWHYFQQNRWRFMQRTATAAPPSDDFTTWDLPRILAEIDKHFTAALAAEKELKQIPVAQYDALLVTGTMPDAYRPTLYDFLAHEALTFYAAGEQAAARPQDAFDLVADSPMFAPAAEFIKWEPQTTDTSSAIIKSIRLYQQLLRFHADDKDQSALADADLARLVYGYNQATGEDKNERYKAALSKLVDRFGDHEIGALIHFQWASVLHGEGNLVEAKKIAERGEKAFPNSIGGKLCHNLIQQIMAKSIQVTTERVWNDPRPMIDVRYRNITKVHFRLVKSDWQKRLRSRAWQPEYLDGDELLALLRMKPDRAWSADLPETNDYQERVERFPAPEDLRPGFYYLVASVAKDFGERENQVAVSGLWVSELAIVTRVQWGDGKVGGFVLDAKSGEPLAGAVVQGWFRGQNNDRRAAPPTKSDENGVFSIDVNQNHSYLIHVTHHGQELATTNEYSNHGERQRVPVHRQVVFFTDRSLYRPGQTIQFKGICCEVDQNGDNYKAVPRVGLTVQFNDPNGKEVARAQVKTNDYGSFSGSFTAPRDRLMGTMTLQVVDGAVGGAAQLNVEEYKRPKFEVTLAAPKEAAKLAGKVKLKGTATAYTGAMVGGARVRYRVVREVRYPPWWGWCYWWRVPRGESQEIVHGSATTEADGTFQIEFEARPDLSVPEKDEPTFVFTTYADVTDTNGETRSANRGVSVGYTALAANLTANPWQTIEKAVEISLRTTTLDGEPQKAEGVLRVYRLKQPQQVQRPEIAGPQYWLMRGGQPGGKQMEPPTDMSNPNSWPLGDVAFEQGMTTDAKGEAKADVKLPVGAYRAVFETQDKFGKKVTAQLPLQVLDPAANKLAIKVPFLLEGPKWTLQPGQELLALWGTGYGKGRAYVEIEHRQKIIKSYWTKADVTQHAIRQEITEALRGGFTVHVTMVRENRIRLESRHVDVPWTNKNLKVRWEHFVSKLAPAQKETWTAVVSGPDAKKAVAEMVATLYDASLDAYLPHHWQGGFGFFRMDYSQLRSVFENSLHPLQHVRGGWSYAYQPVEIRYRSFPQEVIANLWGHQFRARNGAPGRGMPANAPVPEEGLAVESQAAPKSDASGVYDLAEKTKSMETKAARATGDADKGALAQAQQPDLSKVSPRKNLNETAFFFPHLLAGDKGEVKLEFSMPEALTKWKFMGFAHDPQLRSGFLQDEVTTSKDLMVEPNPPRFVREGDVIEFSVKVTNQSAARQAGTVQLTLADAATSRSRDAALKNDKLEQPFDIPSKESRSFSWRLTVPDGAGVLVYKAVGSTGRLSDGEEGYLPVLSRRILVTESLPLPIRGAGNKKFDFAKLLKSGESNTLKHERLTVQMVSNPSWYAVMALPYLMEFPYECTEQTFNRLYANALARHIANSDPKIRRIFDLWKATPALDSPLEKNQDLKAVMLEEAPWLRDANKESEARRNVGILFDANRLNTETAGLLQKLAQQQLPDGAWPWFPGGRGNEFITLYITTGFGRLRHLGVEIDVAPAVKSLQHLDGWINQIYQEIRKHGHLNENHLSSTIALYLYGRSFFLKDQAIAPQNKEAVDYFLGQAKKFWLDLNCRQSQGHLALALKRFGDKETALGIVRSLKERSVENEELGMFWRDLELSWFWFHASIETQAVMIEAFDEVAADAPAVEAQKVWLLKQKQTQNWKTTKSTADAIYALLLRGDNLLASDALVEVSLAGAKIEPEKVEAGTGFYEKRFAGGEVKPELGQVTVKKTDAGVAWGSVHWQYLEDMAKVTPHEGTPLKLKKTLFVRELTSKGPVLKPVAGALAVGDELVVRIELRTDRDMEYVHLKDQRGSGTEPVNVLSQYKYQDGLAYYESTRDTASHFFIDYLPKGVYVFEYATRVVHKGQYQSGIAEIQCMYAPEFNSHSESLGLEVK